MFWIIDHQKYKIKMTQYISFQLDIFIQYDTYTLNIYKNNICYKKHYPVIINCHEKYTAITVLPTNRP